MSRKILIMVLVVAVALVLISAGCGDKQGVIDRDTYAKINNGMTMDEVDIAAGQPERSHSIGGEVFWYFGKTDGEGFIRVVFEDGKVTTISPYDEDFTPES